MVKTIFWWNCETKAKINFVRILFGMCRAKEKVKFLHKNVEFVQSISISLVNEDVCALSVVMTTVNLIIID